MTNYSGVNLQSNLHIGHAFLSVQCVFFFLIIHESLLLSVISFGAVVHGSLSQKSFIGDVR